MAVEREIKLSIPSPAGTTVPLDLPRQLAAYLDALPGNIATVTPGGTQHLVNRYFDTPDARLAQARAALRLRYAERDGATGQWLQTLKAAGHSAAGLHTRHEWEMPVTGAAFDLDALLSACDLPGIATLLREQASALVPLFETNFTRQLWHVTAPQANLDVALDQGEVAVVLDGIRHAEPLREVEIELAAEAHADVPAEAEAALQTFARVLQHQFAALHPDNISKAERGYRLRERVLTQGS